MAVFRDAKQPTKSIGGLFDLAAKEPELVAKLKATGPVIRLYYREPDAVLTIDCKNPPRKPGRLIDWSGGTGEDEPEVEFFMAGDVGHRFWLGKVNLLGTLAEKDVVTHSSVFQVVKILPLLNPFSAQYPKILAAEGKLAAGRA